MPTPDPIARHELLRSIECVIQRRWLANKIDGYTREMAIEIADALTPAPQVPGDMALVPREATPEMVEVICDRHAGKSVWPDDYGHPARAIRRRQAREGYRAMLAVAALNEPFGNPEELPLNEPSGDSGQLASLEQRARGLFEAQADPLAAPWERQWEPTKQYWRGQAAALSAQPREVECAHDWRGDGLCDRCGATYTQPREVRGVEYDRELIAEMLDDLLRAEAAAEDRGTTEGRSYFNRNAIATQAQLLREADNREGQARTVRLGPATTPQDAAGVEEMSPDFTDSARAAIAWVLYHHQGGSSPVGQPLRFALGMGAHDPLPDWRIAEAKRYAEWAGASTEQFHTTPPPGVDVGKLRELMDQWRVAESEAAANSVASNEDRDAYAHDFEREAYKSCADKLAAIIDAAAPGVGNG